LKNNIILIITIIGFLSQSCTKNLTVSTIVYQNDFNRSSTKNLVTFDYYGATKDKLFLFNGSKVLGPFNNAGVDVNIDSMPSHNVLEISFDLYIHDNWEGNKPTQYNIPDLFVVKYDGNPRFLTTFSSNAQYKQSFPEWFPQGQNPAFGNALKLDLPGRCAWKERTNGTAMYKFVRQFPHANSTFQLSLSDALQPFESECEKSWSIDNIKITAFTYF
jgi:hypothetical protein